MTIASAFNKIAVAQGGTASTSGTIAGAIDALNDALAGSDQECAQTIEGAIELLGQHIGGGSTPTGTIYITENGEGIDVAQYAYADVSVSGGATTEYNITCYDKTYSPIASHLYPAVYVLENDTWIADPEYTGAALTKAKAGDILCWNVNNEVILEWSPDISDETSDLFSNKYVAMTMPAMNVDIVTGTLEY